MEVLVLVLRWKILCRSRPESLGLCLGHVLRNCVLCNLTCRVRLYYAAYLYSQFPNIFTVSAKTTELKDRVRNITVSIDFVFVNFVSMTVFDRVHYDEVLSDLFTQLWDCDENRCEPGFDYTLDLQGI